MRKMDDNNIKRKRCSHTTNSGKRCKNKCPEGCDSCPIHKHTPPYKNCRECSVCLMNMNKDRYALSCGHEFHKRCIELSRKKDPMLLIKCPICRIEPFVMDQLKYYERYYLAIEKIYQETQENQESKFIKLSMAINRYISIHITDIKKDEQKRLLANSLLLKLNRKINLQLRNLWNIIGHISVISSGINSDISQNNGENSSNDNESNDQSNNTNEGANSNMSINAAMIQRANIQQNQGIEVSLSARRFLSRFIDEDL